MSLVEAEHFEVVLTTGLGETHKDVEVYRVVLSPEASRCTLLRNPSDKSNKWMNKDHFHNNYNEPPSPFGKSKSECQIPNFVRQWWVPIGKSYLEHFAKLSRGCGIG